MLLTYPELPCLKRPDRDRAPVEAWASWHGAMLKGKAAAGATSAVLGCSLKVLVSRYEAHELSAVFGDKVQARASAICASGTRRRWRSILG